MEHGVQAGECSGVGTACLPLLGLSFCLETGGVLPIHPPPPPASMRHSLSLWSLCHVFFATWYHLTREVASRSPAEDLGAFQVLGERDAVTAVTSSELGGVPWNPEAASASQQS